jgi:hypothetical protein
MKKKVIISVVSTLFVATVVVGALIYTSFNDPIRIRTVERVFKIDIPESGKLVSYARERAFFDVVDAYYVTLSVPKNEIDDFIESLTDYSEDESKGHSSGIEGLWGPGDTVIDLGEGNCNVERWSRWYHSKRAFIGGYRVHTRLVIEKEKDGYHNIYLCQM